MSKINLNQLAKEIALREGGSEEVSIAQIKEILGLALDELSRRPASEVLALLESLRR